MNKPFSIIARFHRLAALFIGGCIGFGVFDHLLNVVVRQAARGFNTNGLFFAGRLIGSRHIDQTIGVNVESHFDLWHAAWRWWNAFKVELAEIFIIRGHFALTLTDRNRHRRLIVIGG